MVAVTLISSSVTVVMSASRRVLCATASTTVEITPTSQPSYAAVRRRAMAWHTSLLCPSVLIGPNLCAAP